MLPDFSQKHAYLHFHGRGGTDHEDANPNLGQMLILTLATDPNPNPDSHPNPPLL